MKEHLLVEATMAWSPPKIIETKKAMKYKMLMEGEFQSGGESFLLMIFSQHFNRKFSYTPMLMLMNIVVNIHKENKITFHKLNTSIQHMREGGGWGITNKVTMFYQIKINIHVRVFKSMTYPKICL